MEKELVGLFETAKKAADSAVVDGASKDGPDVDRCVDALKLLKSFPVSYDVLVSTQVAKRLRHLTKHPIEQIQTMALDVVDIWKKIVIDETLKKKNANLDNNSSTKTEVKVGKSEKIDKRTSNNSGSYMRSDSIKVEKKTVSVETTVKAERVEKTEKIKIEKTKEVKQESVVKRPSQSSLAPPKLSSIVKCNDPIRDKMRELLFEALSKVSAEAEGSMKDKVEAHDPVRVAVAVESFMFEKLGRSNGRDKHKYRSIMFNLKDQNNPDFRRKVLLGEVTAAELINMTPDDMASDERQLQNKQLREKALFECERESAPKATTNEFKCGRCGQRKTTYYQLQTRSADEPMTTFVTCVNCNNHWKFC